MKGLEARGEVVAFLRRGLVGPDPQPEHLPLNGGEEILRPQDPPRLRYSVGVLFPAKDAVVDADNAAAEEVDQTESGPAEGEEPEAVGPAGGSGGDGDPNTEQEVNRANEFLPSAMGLTAVVRLGNELRVTVRCARYEKKAMPGLGRADKEGRWQPHYWRHPINDTLLIECGQFAGRGPTIGPKLWVRTGDEDLRLQLHVFSRPFPGAEDAARDRIITFTLINRTESPGGAKDIHCAFQCEFSVEDAAGNACFLAYPEADLSDQDAEDQALKLLYRDCRTFAIGHGCSAQWSEPQSGAARTIATDVLPAFEVKPIVPASISGLALSMRDMAKDELWEATIANCRGLASEYLVWINDQELVLATNGDLTPAQHEAGSRHLASCRRCHSRILSGIGLLDSDEGVARVFRWMNMAMLHQQLHYNLATDHRRGWDVGQGVMKPTEPYVRPDYENLPPNKGTWRPFQLAFILMNIGGIVDPADDDRDTVDLIWFPTGGGKTEAYLGLTAFTILHRRLLDPQDSGTTVLMRYTLRLLTTQQYQRASSLICACELIRRRNEALLGPERISIGLWVGNSVTPNKHGEARSALQRLLNEGKPNPFVILTCPWCGVEMGPVRFREAYRTPGYRNEGGQVIFKCADPSCDFSASPGLPLVVVDQAIYEHPPTLVVGTVDKFAMLPWVPEASALFGGQDTGLSPPDLIIQDELHLISGALGSMVGLYETVIDALCRRETTKGSRGAKIVASTATICRAADQVNGLYARDLFLFPPQGLRAGESFFARRDESTAGRLYVGVFGSALSSHVTAQIRVVSSLLQAVKCLPGGDAKAIDPYWTLMAYFNSLRELGHAATLIRADIREYMNALWDRLNIRRPEPGSGQPDRRRFINRDLELTSRIQSSDVTEVLQSLFEQYSDVVDAEGRSQNRAVDICLATNMIQVGLDVPRLGLMAVIGQPKTTSEYIQATSRVGRGADGPGLVVTIYNTAKPRDRSHYEHFRSYHQALYRWVEPTSVTPFAIPVRERALHAQIVTLVRYLDSRYRDTPRPVPDDRLVAEIRNLILARVARADESEAESTEIMIREIISSWRRLQPGIYGSMGMPPDETPLMYPNGVQPRLTWANRSRATPTSMRNVDAGCDASVISSYPAA